MVVVEQNWKRLNRYHQRSTELINAFRYLYLYVWGLLGPRS
jgi:hypothetical protein